MELIMKKTVAIILLLTICCTLLASCDLLDSLLGSTSTPEAKPDPDPTPIVRGDSAVIFGKNTAFTLVYPKDDEASADLADRMASAVESLGLKKPDLSADADKKDTQCELVIGETARAISADAKAALADAIAADPYGDHWIWIYKDGRAALYANNADAYELGLAELTEKYYKAGEVTMKTNLSSSGYVEGPHKAYMEYDVPDNFFDGYTDPFGMSEKDYKQMTITSVSDKIICISHRDENGGTYSADFVQKVWGVWMMGEISYTERSGIKHIITPSSTDYEFVFHIGAEGPVNIKSGNHGNYPSDKTWTYVEDDTSYYNDRMLDLTFYDGKSGEKLELPAIGKSIVVDGLRIVEHHNVYEFNYKQENVLINAERNYLYNGFDIMCDSKLYITKDVRIGGSYGAMLPIQKQYGNCAMFYLEDGSTIYMKTPLSGSVNESVYGAKAVYVDLWGENNPRYHMIVTINNPEDQYRSPAVGTNKGYAGLRDMQGGSQNKLYIQLGGTNFDMKWGEELHFNTKWTFSIQKDFRNPDREPDFWVGVKK